jgi:hypothetical protein
MITLRVAAVGLVLACASSSRADPSPAVPGPSLGVSVVVTATGPDAASRIFTYRYRIANHPASGAAIASIELEGMTLWTARAPSSRLAPGQAVDGVPLVSRGLPGIRVVEARPANANSSPATLLTFRTRTVGPGTPPADLVSVDILGDLITMLDESRQLGWIRTGGVHRELRARLTAVRRALDAGDVATGRLALTTFLDEVRAAACHDFHCGGHEPLTSEAYALLLFNGELVLDGLAPRPGNP